MSNFLAGCIGYAEAIGLCVIGVVAFLTFIGAL